MSAKDTLIVAGIRSLHWARLERRREETYQETNRGISVIRGDRNHLYPELSVYSVYSVVCSLLESEIWRTAPYLHDGSAATLREVLTTRNRGDRHGHTSHLSRRQLDDLCAYLLSL